MGCSGNTGSTKAQDINRWVLVGLNVVSWIFSVVTTASCTFITVSYHDFYDIYGFLQSGVKDHIGLFSADIGGSCNSFSAEGAPYFKAGRAFGILQNLSLVFSMTGILLVISCLRGKAARWVWLLTKILYILTLLWTLLIFVTFGDCSNSDETIVADCKPGAAAIINIINVLFVLVMATLCWFVPIPAAPICGCCGGNTSPHQKSQPAIVKDVPSKDPSAPPSGGTIVKRTVENTPQGRKITEEVTHPDGSKTITETFEQMVDHTMTEGEEEVAYSGGAGRV